MSRDKFGHHTGRRIAAGLLITAAAALPACASTPAESLPETHADVAKVEAVPGTDVSKVTLTADAGRRIDVRTEAVRTVKVKGEQRTVVPYSAVLYLADGDAYAYSSPGRLQFVRVPLTIDFIDGELAVLSDGPEVGTQVATVGVAELLGTEFEVGH